MIRPPLMDHQIRTINFACKHPYAVLALDPRLGKSRCAIETREKLDLPCVIVCPSYLIDNWKLEINKWTNKKYILAIHSGKDIPAFERNKESWDYVIVSYGLARKAEQIFEWAKMVVLDEAPAIKSMASKRTEFLHRVVYENSMESVLLLTGTPIKNRVQEFYSLLAMTYYDPNDSDPKFLKEFPDEITFADHFAHRKEFRMELPNGKIFKVLKFDGIQRVPELKNWLKDKYIRIRDTDVLGMPPVSIKPVLISDVGDPELLKTFNAFFKSAETKFEKASDKYDKLAEKLEDNDSISKKEKKVLLKKANRDYLKARKENANSIASDHKATAALKKVPFTVDYVKNLLEEVECCLIYTDHRESAKALAEAFETIALTGEMPSKKRGLHADQFQAGEGKVLVATVGALKEGKPLHRANHIVFNDLAWVPGDLKQVHNRIRAVGKTKKCTIHRIFGSPQDSYIADTLDSKQDVIDKAT